MWESLTLLGIGTLAGLAGGTLGVGGGFFLVPVLFGWLNWGMISAVASSHFCGLAVSTSATGTYADARLIDWRLGVIMAAATVTGSAVGALGVRWVSTEFVAILFCLVSIYSGYRMWRPEKFTGVGDFESNDPTTGHQWLLGLPAMFLVGVASGVLGLGGGVFMVPILTEIMHLPMRRAVGTSVFMVGINAAAAASVFHAHGDVIAAPTSLLVAGAFAGAFAGASVQHRLPSGILRRVFAVLLVALAIRLAWRAIG